MGASLPCPCSIVGGGAVTESEQELIALIHSSVPEGIQAKVQCPEVSLVIYLSLLNKQTQYRGAEETSMLPATIVWFTVQFIYTREEHPPLNPYRGKIKTVNVLGLRLKQNLGEVLGVFCHSMIPSQAE